MTQAAPTAPGMLYSPRIREATIVRTDEQLLRQFLAGSGEPAETAFAALVERYSRIVYGVCLDVLGCPHDAQDAAQAVFLVLARRARSIRRPESLGPWLHGVAVRVARRASRELARRRVVERKKAELIQHRDTTSSRPQTMDHTDLHAEIDRLPEKYRQPIILCYLQGQTQTEAAQTLGWPLGTVQIRLHRGRERLRSTLTRRGAGLIAVTGSQLTPALALPPGFLGGDWTKTTARAAVRFAAGSETAGLVTPPVSRLAESVLNGMLADSLKVIALTVISCVFISAGLFFTMLSWQTSRHELAHAESRPAPAPLNKPQPALAAPIPKVPRTIVEKSDLTADPFVPLAIKPPIVERTEGPLEKTKTPTPRPVDRSVVASAIPPSPASPDRSMSLGASGRRAEKKRSDGRELFERIWVQNDPRSHGGDGLGPVFNAQSCVACHNQGGTGGAGAFDKNIEIASASDTLGNGTGYFYSFSMDFGAGRFEYNIGGDPSASSRRRTPADTTLLGGIHPGFRESNSTVLHHFGTDPAYQAWRGLVPGRHNSIMIRSSQRNPPPLFGAGLIDSIPDTAIAAATRRKAAGSAQVKGRVSRLKDGRIGRFGWKAQTATLADFVRSAAAGEIGLEIPGRHQAADPRLPGIAPAGLDMNESECDALVDYVRSLRAPGEIEPTDVKDPALLKVGESTFKSVGCTGCHTPKLGNVEGIYSDLLLHDMGPQLADADAYSVFAGEPPPPAEGPPAAGRVHADGSTASVREWRTPPLWGIRDSGPYLHDGRAATIAESIILHAGQGANSARRYAELPPRRKQQLEAFVMSLAVPAAD